jgi:hypothetical protein
MPNEKTMMTLALLAAAALALPAAADPQQAMVVVRDAATGQLRAATPAEVKILRAQETQRGMAAPKPEGALVVRENGTVHKHLGESAMVYAVTVRDADGKLGMQCIQGEQAAKAALDAPTPAARPTEEHRHESH